MVSQNLAVPQKFGLFINPNKKSALEYLNKIITYFERINVGYVISDRKVAEKSGHLDKYLPEKDFCDSVDLLIALGGDGTLLRAARSFAFSGKPILGINLGGLGFLTMAMPEDLEKNLQKLVEGDFLIQERMSIKCKPQNVVALNDIVVSSKTIARIIKIEVFINEEYLTTYNADGLIISTPTGSTAHALSAGGPILSPDTEVIQLAPICPHALTNRPLIVNKDSNIKISLKSCAGDVLITVDGQTSFSISKDKYIEVSAGDHTVNLVSFKNNSYYDILRRKLNWGGRG